MNNPCPIRQADKIWDAQCLAAELRQDRLKESADYLIESEIESVLIEMVYTLEPEEVNLIPKLLKEGEFMLLGILMQKAIERTSLCLAELGED